MARLPDGALMQRAAAGLASAVADFLGRTYGARVLLLVGSGDNGGDALHAGALLARRGAAVEAVLLSPGPGPRRGPGRLRGAGRPGRRRRRRGPPDLVVDGIVGIGGRAGSATDAAALVAGARRRPGGRRGHAQRGRRRQRPASRARTCGADLTVTFGTHKVAHLVDPAAQACGAVHLVDIGLDLPAAASTALQAADVARLLPRPGPTAHKYTRGVVGVRAGSEEYPGAAVLCVGRRRDRAGRDGPLRRRRRRPGARRPPRGRGRPRPGAGLGGRLRRWRGGGGGRRGGAGRRGPGGPRRGRARLRCEGPPPVPGAAHPARRRAGPHARGRARARSRPTSSGTPARRPDRFGCVGPAQGPAHPGRRPGRPGPGHHGGSALAGHRRRR